MISPEGLRPLPSDNQKRENTAWPRATETLKRHFRDLVKAITAKAPTPQPTTRKRKEGEGGQAAFRMAGRKIVFHRAVRIPAKALAAARDYLWDTLTWLDQWNQHGDDPTNDIEVDTSTHLYPHL
jgi:hypothetical protein